MVLSTHILPEVEQVCERVAIIDRGRIVADGTPDALRARMMGNPQVQVEIQGANGDGRDALMALPGISGVTASGEGNFLVEHPPDHDPRAEIFKLVVDRGWVLTTLAPTRATLEDVFVRLTTREDVAADEEV
mgnify:FL=1